MPIFAVVAVWHRAAPLAAATRSSSSSSQGRSTVPDRNDSKDRRESRKEENVSYGVSGDAHDPNKELKEANIVQMSQDTRGSGTREVLGFDF